MPRVDQLLRATARAESSHFWFRGLRWFIAPMIERALAGRPGARILDCGCGTGANLAFLDRYGVNYGFDLSEVGLYIARGAGRTRIVRASVTAVPFPTGAFDLVTSFDVLYSLQSTDERQAVAEMFRVARPGGFALINVAALDVLRGNHSVLSHEVRRYSRGSLRALVGGAGFEILRLTYTNVSLFAPMLVVRGVQRAAGLAQEEHAEGEITVPFAPVNAALSGLLWLESLWLSRFDNPAGTSLLCLARKPA